MKTQPEELRVTAASIARLAAVVDETYAKIDKKTQQLNSHWRNRCS
ncbi:MAG: hypothetical protein K6G44_15600 [Lentisphaeria bacterium]|nr:hypothetical protein [Lentisphaeria bacterium]